MSSHIFASAVTRRFGNALLSVVAAIVSVAVVAPAHAQLIINGSFEQGNFTGINSSGDAGATQLFAGNTNITDWTVFNNELSWDQIGNPYGISASDGARFLDLTGLHDSQPEGGVSQALSLVAGNTYRLTFDVGYSNRYPTVNDGVTVSLTGLADKDFIYSSATNLASNWQTQTYDFTAAQSATTLGIVGYRGASGAYIGLDNVALVQTGSTAAPEASSLALVALGGLVGLVVRARRSRNNN